MFSKINFSEIILNQYMQSWYVWVVLFIIGVLLVKYSYELGTTYREIKKMETSGAGLIAVSSAIHCGVIWALV